MEDIFLEKCLQNRMLQWRKGEWGRRHVMSTFDCHSTILIILLPPFFLSTAATSRSSCATSFLSVTYQQRGCGHGPHKGWSILNPHKYISVDQLCEGPDGTWSVLNPWPQETAGRGGGPVSTSGVQYTECKLLPFTINNFATTWEIFS